MNAYTSDFANAHLIALAIIVIAHIIVILYLLKIMIFNTK